MKTRLKVMKWAFGAVIAAALLHLAGCPDWNAEKEGGDTGYITLNLTGSDKTQNSSARAAYPPTDTILSQLIFTVNFTNGSAADKTVTVGPGQTTVTVALAAGTWEASTQAMLNGVLYARGTQSIEVKPGSNGTTMLTLYNAQIQSQAMCTVNFDCQNGKPNLPSATVPQGNPVADPGSVPGTKATLVVGTLYKITGLGWGEDIFGGWFTDPACTLGNDWNFSDPVMNDMTLYAKWDPDPLNIPISLTVVPPSNIVAAALNLISIPGNDGKYELILDTDISNFAGTAVANYNNPGGRFTLRANSPQTISLDTSTQGSIFYSAAGDLILENITLDGQHTINNQALVYVDSGSYIQLRDGGIKNNENTSGTGGGVHVATSGEFNLAGGTISGNIDGDGITTFGKGGGVHIETNGIFRMGSGTITGNTANYDSTSPSPTNGVGGGVYSCGYFEMFGGTISGNEAGLGGGVYLNQILGGTLRKVDSMLSNDTGTITGSDGVPPNRATPTPTAIVGGAYTNSGQAVYVYTNPTPTSNDRYRDTTAGPTTELDSLDFLLTNWNQ